MPIPTDLRTSSVKLEELDCTALVVGAFSGEGGPRLSEIGADVVDRLSGSLNPFLLATGFSGANGEVRVAPVFEGLGAEIVVVVGLGEEAEIRPSSLRHAAEAAGQATVGSEMVASALHVGLEGEWAPQVAGEGLIFGLHRFADQRSTPTRSTASVRFLRMDADALRRVEAYASATAVARDLSETPGSDMTPEALAEASAQVAADAGLQCTILGPEELHERGFGGILAVARGSSRSPRLIHLRYQPKAASGRVALVGKGVTFDTGGINLKPDIMSLPHMKYDMAGGAAIVGTMSALASLGSSLEVEGLVAATDNVPDAKAYLPGDVIRHYGGRTTEILDTDAEGRLLLADCLAYVSEDRPEVVVDIATLTSNIVHALGPEITGLFSESDALADELLAAGDRAGQYIWRLPIHYGYEGDIASRLADAANQQRNPDFIAGAIKAALFLRPFVPPGIAWAHLDIGGTAYIRDDHQGAGATGIPTSTLLSWLEQRGQ